MLYFTLWVVFMLTVILAVPIVAFVEKRRYRAANPETAVETADEAEPWSDEAEGEADPLAEEQSISAEPEEAVEFGEADGGEEFADFDEIQ